MAPQLLAIVQCPADRGDSPYSGRVMGIGETICRNIYGIPYVWLTVRNIATGRESVWPSHRLGFTLSGESNPAPLSGELRADILPGELMPDSGYQIQVNIGGAWECGDWIEAVEDGVTGERIESRHATREQAESELADMFKEMKAQGMEYQRSAWRVKYVKGANNGQ